MASRLKEETANNAECGSDGAVVFHDSDPTTSLNISHTHGHGYNNQGSSSQRQDEEIEEEMPEVEESKLDDEAEEGIETDISFVDQIKSKLDISIKVVGDGEALTPESKSDFRSVLSGNVRPSGSAKKARKVSYLSPSVSEKSVLMWMQETYIENAHGKVDCKLVTDMMFDKFGCRKRMIATWIRKAFPCVYLRRSDRNRWYCGISLICDDGQNDLKEEDKIWINRAVEWLKTSMEMDPNCKERCADIHRALIENMGTVTVDKAIAAFKMVFPNIPRKSYTRIAFYVGIKFKDSSLRSENTQVTDYAIPTFHDNTKSQFLNSAANKLIVCWLQKALIEDKNSRDKLRIIKGMVKIRFGRNLSLRRIGQLVRKAFPSIEFKIKGVTDGIVWGIRINEAHKPTDAWTQKAVHWLERIIDKMDDTYEEETDALFDLMMKRLALDSHAKCLILLKEAYPDNNFIDVPGSCIMYGLHLRDIAQQIHPPWFTAEDISIGSYIFDLDDEDERTREDTIETVPATPTPSDTGIPTMVMSYDDEIKQRLSSLENHVTSLDFKLSKLLQNTAEVKEELKNIRAENSKSAQHKDSLIVQLQQTLIMLCQHQLQKLFPTVGESPENVLANILQKGFQSPSPT